MTCDVRAAVRGQGELDEIFAAKPPHVRSSVTPAIQLAPAAWRCMRLHYAIIAAAPRRIRIRVWPPAPERLLHELLTHAPPHLDHSKGIALRRMPGART
jgi:hypothetical protein